MLWFFLPTTMFVIGLFLHWIDGYDSRHSMYKEMTELRWYFVNEPPYLYYTIKWLLLPCYVTFLLIRTLYFLIEDYICT